MLKHSQGHISAHRVAIIRELDRQAKRFFYDVARLIQDGGDYAGAFVEVASTWPTHLDWQPGG